MNNKMLFFLLFNFILFTFISYLLTNNIIFSIIATITLFIVVLFLYISYSKIIKKEKKKLECNEFIIRFIEQYKINSNINKSIEHTKQYVSKELFEIIDNEIIEDGLKFLNSLKSYFSNNRYETFLELIRSNKELIEFYDLCKNDLKLYENKKRIHLNILLTNYLYWIIPFILLLISRLAFCNVYNEMELFNIVSIIIVSLYSLIIFNSLFIFLLLKNNINKKSLYISVIYSLLAIIINVIYLIFNFSIFNIILLTINILVQIIFIISESNINKALILNKKIEETLINNEKQYFLDNFKLNERINELDNTLINLSNDTMLFINNSNYLRNLELIKKKSNNYLIIPNLFSVVVIIVICVLILGSIRGLYNG